MGKKMAKKKNEVRINTDEMLDRLKALRKDRELKEEHLAHELGIDTDTYIGKETGSVPFTLKEWLRVSIVMNVRLSYFITG
jgi:DNA-binding XRE family transcriptional regulator